MAKKPESRLQRRIQDHLRDKFPGVFVFKVHGGPYMAAGLPDLICCVDGLFIGLEVKLPIAKSKPSEIQIQTLKEIRAAGGAAQVVRSPAEAEAVVLEAKEASKNRA